MVFDGFVSYELMFTVLGFGALVVYLLGRELEKYDLGKMSSAMLTLGIIGLSFLLLLFAPSETTSLFAFNEFSKYVGAVILGCSFLISLASWGYSEIEYIPEYFALLSASTIGMLLIPIANNLIVLYTAWELMSIPAYALVALKTNREEATEAAFKYFIFGAISSALILYGMSIFYGVTGTLTIPSLIANLKSDWKVIEYIGIITLTAGFGIKVGIIPFHMWIPDTYQGAPLTVSTFLTTSSKNAGFGAIAKVLILGLTFTTLPVTSLLQFPVRNLLAILALITMIGGNIFALAQKNVIRMLAYSSITHAGYILVGITVATFNKDGLTASLFHLLTYSFSDIAAFICAAFFLSLGAKTIDDYNGITDRSRFTSFIMTFALLSLAGVPGLAGFASKLFLFFAGIDGNMLWLSIALALNSAFSLGYYGRLIKRMFMHEGKWETSSESALPVSYIVVFVSSFVLVVILGVRPSLFVNLANNATDVLLS